MFNLCWTLFYSENNIELKNFEFLKMDDNLSI